MTSLLTRKCGSLLALMIAVVLRGPVVAAGPPASAAGPVSFLEVAGGSLQSTVAGTAFAEPIVIRALDSNGLPVPDVTITFTPAPASGASVVVSAATAVTDASGMAAVSGTANLVTGVHFLQAQAPRPGGFAVATAQLVNLATAPGSLVLRQGNAQTAPVGHDFAIPLEVTVRNPANALMPNVAVDFTGPLTGPGLAYVDTGTTGNRIESYPIPGGGRVLTDAAGVARAFVTANALDGAYLVTGHSAGLATTLTFSLTNAPLVAAAILPSGSREVVGVVTSPGQRFNDIAFRVVDQLGLGLPGAVVQLAAPASGPTMTLDAATLITDSDGWVHTGATAGGAAGTYSVAATTAGLPQPAYLLAQNRPPGFAVGEPLADVSGFDHAGQPQSLRGLLAGGSYLVLDVCAGWCSACRLVQSDAQAARAELTALGIPTTVVPLLVDSGTPNQPSGQADAMSWHAQYAVADPVLHASGLTHAGFWDAGWYVLGVQRPGFPTYLLVAPDGTVLNRHVGALPKDELVAFVSAAVPQVFDASDVTVAENAGTALVTVTRTLALTTASIDYTTMAGTAGAADFSARAGTLSFAAGQRSATVAVPIVNDVIDEPAESFSLELSSPSAGSIGRGTGAIVITDDDAPSAVSIDDVRVSEGSTGGLKTVLVPVRLDRPSGFTVSGTVVMTAGTATAKDVVLTSGKFTIPPGQVTQTIAVGIVADTLVEPKESFTITLSAPVNAVLADASAVVTIVDDDADTVTPVIAAKGDVVAEVKMASTLTAAVSFTNPIAKDDKDGAVPTVCAPASGSRFLYGVTPVSCTAEDRAGNLATSTFNVVVQMPVIAGALFRSLASTTPLTSVTRDQELVVRVGPGAFAPRAGVRLALLDASGERFDLRATRAENDGSLLAWMEVPERADLGPAQVVADSASASGEYDRSWFVTVLRRR